MFNQSCAKCEVVLVDAMGDELSPKGAYDASWEWISAEISGECEYATRVGNAYPWEDNPLDRVGPIANNCWLSQEAWLTELVALSEVYY